MKEEDIIARKSYASGGCYILGFILCLALSIILIKYYSVEEVRTSIYLIISIPASIVILILIINFYRLPYILISKDNDNIIIHYSKDIIPLDKITDVIQINSHSRLGTFSFGKIIIKTIDYNEISISNVADVDAVKTRILKLLRK